MRILITGGLGVIGSLLAHRYIDAGHQVMIADPGDEPRNRWIERGLLGKCEIRRYGIEECAPDLVPQADAIIHAGASTGIPYSVTAPMDDWRRNVDATHVLLEAIHASGRKIPTVVLSSIKPYRVEPLPPHGLDESAMLEPDEPYAASKAAQSMLCQAYARSYGLPVVTFRCSNLYGPAPCHGPRHGWLTWFAISAAIGRPIAVQGSGEQVRDMLHASDVFRAVDTTLRLLSGSMEPMFHARAVEGRVFNLGGGRENTISVGQAAHILREQTSVEITHAPPRAMDDERVFVDTSAFWSATGWSPKVSVLDGLRDVLRWATAHKAELMKLYEGV